jgi:hypothetical protein
MAKQGRKLMAKNTRGPDFPYSRKLERLLRTFAPEIGYFEMEMNRRNVTALRKYFEGPEAIDEVPSGSRLTGMHLPGSWNVFLCYSAPEGPGQDWKVDALFEPPYGPPSRLVEPIIPAGAGPGSDPAELGLGPD